MSTEQISGFFTEPDKAVHTVEYISVFFGMDRFRLALIFESEYIELLRQNSEFLRILLQIPGIDCSPHTEIPAERFRERRCVSVICIQFFHGCLLLFCVIRVISGN
jgi:hypothetical protein